MSTYTKEQLIQHIGDMMASSKEMIVGNGVPEEFVCRAERDIAVYEIALASLEAEPVGEVVLGEYDDSGCHPDARVACIAADGQADWGNFKDGTRLYTAPPAPASVPDDFDFSRLAFEKWITENYDSRIMRSGTGYAGRVLNQMWQCWLACRAAMLHGAEPVSNRDEFPDGWVACSERMPEDDDFVYIWPRPDFGVELHVAQYGKFDKRDAGWYAQVYEQNYGIEYYPVMITHWMPLPAAPRQEVTL